MEEEIARLLMKMAKFEFYLVNSDSDLAHTRKTNRFDVISGINWTKLADKLERKVPFAAFDFEKTALHIFKETAPQYLVRADGGRLKWDSDDVNIDSWERLLSRSYAQLRNNLAHGNKAQMPAPFTYDRTAQLLEAGHALIEFISREAFNDPHWETPIRFQ